MEIILQHVVYLSSKPSARQSVSQPALPTALSLARPSIHQSPFVENDDDDDDEQRRLEI